MKNLITENNLLNFLPWLYALLFVVVGIVLASLTSRVIQRINEKRAETQQFIILRKALFVLILLLFIAGALQQVGFKLSVLLGAAGVLTVAIGFASQTSVSNIISGIFLILERSFSVGDTIKVGGTTGKVIAIDLLSVKLKTSDNIFVRISNENLIKSEIQNITKYKIRRLAVPVSVVGGVNVNELSDTLIKLTMPIAGCLDKPAPSVTVESVNCFETKLTLYVWVMQEQITAINNQLQIAISQMLADQKIDQF